VGDKGTKRRRPSEFVEIFDRQRPASALPLECRPTRAPDRASVRPSSHTARLSLGNPMRLCVFALNLTKLMEVEKPALVDNKLGLVINFGERILKAVHSVGQWSARAQRS